MDVRRVWKSDSEILSDPSITKTTSICALQPFQKLFFHPNSHIAISHTSIHKNESYTRKNESYKIVCAFRSRSPKIDPDRNVFTQGSAGTSLIFNASPSCSHCQICQIYAFYCLYQERKLFHCTTMRIEFVGSCSNRELVLRSLGLCGRTW